jgi:hypothetical protein
MSGAGKWVRCWTPHCKQTWETMGRIMDEQARLRDLDAADTPDPGNVGAQYAAIAKRHQQIIESHVEVPDRVQALQQKQRFKQWLARAGEDGTAASERDSGRMA